MKKLGFTLIELIIVISIIALIATGILIAVNPARRIGETKDAERWSDITAIAKAIDNYTADNGHMPSDFNIGTLTTDSKVVLCSSASQLTCDGQTNDCAVINDTDFLGSYLPQLPVDPDKNNNSDTGYYVTVTAGNVLSFGVCNPYSNSNAPIVTSKTEGWTCGSNLINPIDDLTYGSVLALDGNCWMDRNLGATQRATSGTDSSAYGYLYQWGRYTDGHQTRTSATTATLSSSDTPGHGDFITTSASPYDWRSPQNNNLWQGENGTNNPCPNGWRIPTRTEWITLASSEGITNKTNAYTSNLKLTLAGRRKNQDGTIDLFNSYGYYWSSTINGTNIYYLYISDTVSNSLSAERARGGSVRCIKD